jgi:hypothetical protein
MCSESQMSGFINIRQVHQKRKLVKMKTNVISNPFTIECLTGSLEILGVGKGKVAFRLRGDIVRNLLRSQPDFCKNCTFLNDLNECSPHMKNMLIFEYSLREELRNPRKLLKSVRNKLVQTGFRNHREVMEELDREYSMTDREEHYMFR